MRHVRSTFIQASVPLSRGPVQHYEHNDEIANTAFTKDAGNIEVAEIHTPQNTLKRIHEVMHARHTDPLSYPDMGKKAAQIIEDCHIHLNHWPWKEGETPEPIKESAVATVKSDLSLVRTFADMLPDGKFARFASKLRATAIYRGASIAEAGLPAFDGENEQKMAKTLLELIKAGRKRDAYDMLQRSFLIVEDGRLPGAFSKFRVRGKSEKADNDEEIKEEKELYKGPNKSWMKVIELKKDTPIQIADEGFRRATCGPRLYRPALRRPILSPRLFLKKAPYDPCGVVCFDSSGSMKITEKKLNDCCQRAPTAVVGYYEGMDGSSQGWLWVYARDGMRASESPLNRTGGNAIDGFALDWMLSFAPPRILVTDREFCGGWDSLEQCERLARLEALGEITVYTSFNAFQAAFPLIAA